MNEYKFDEKKHVHTLNGKRLHGVTTVLGSWGNPGMLINWAANQAVDAIERGETPEEARKAHIKKRDKAGDRGTEVHAELETMMNDLIDGKLDGSYSDITTSVYDWLTSEGIKPLESEKCVYSRQYWYGGICDAVIEKDGKKFILDFKTSGFLHPKNFFQMGAYSLALKLMKAYDKIDGVVVVHIPKGASFDPEKNIYWRYDIKELENTWLNILNTYKLDKDLNKLIKY